MKSIKIPYEDLKKVNERYFKDLEKASTSCIESGWYILGKNVTQFENEFARINNSEFCIGVANGLDALILGLLAFEFKNGGKVLVPSNTYIASILAIYKAGLQPVLVEPDPETYNISIENIKKCYTKDCVAIMTVHLYGRLCPMDDIMDFAKEKQLRVVEDCAQSHFARLGNKYSGTFGDIGAFSFYPTKNLGALGDAGAILCKDRDIYEKIKALRNYGSQKKYYNDFMGLNSRLDEIQAAFLNAKLKDRENVIAHKKLLAREYFKFLSKINEIQLPLMADENNVWHIFNILTKKRNELKEFLLENGIATEIHYPVAPHNQVGYKDEFIDQKFPISEYIHNSTLSLPISTCHSLDDVKIVSELIISFFKK